MTRTVPRGARATGASLAVLVVLTIGLVASLIASRPRPTPLAHTRPSPEALARDVIRAMDAGDLPGLHELALTREEFRAHVWPHLPASQPDRNVPFEFAWNMLHQTSRGYLQQTLDRLSGQTITLARVESSGATSVYGLVTVRRGTDVVVRDPTGHERRVRLFGSMIEQDGGWKVFSYVAEP
jgi:hypothetical protein